MSSDLKSGWSYNKLDDLGFVGRGRSRHRPRNDPSLYGGPYPFFQTGNVKAAEFYLKDYDQTYNEKGLAQSKLWDPDTLLITIAANIAESAILKVSGCFPDSIVGFVADPEKSDVRWVKYAIDTMKLRMQAISGGTTQDNLSLGKLLTFDFLTPPLPTQRKIAAVLSAYDDLVENNTRRIAVLEEAARLLYQEWFVRFRFPGHEDIAMVESELGPVPEEWEVKPFTDEVDVLSGGTPRTSVSEYWNGTIPWMTPKDIGNTFYTLDTERKITELGLSKCNSRLYPAETVFITARGTVGRCVLAAVPMAMSQTSYALIGRQSVPQHFVYLLTLDLVEALKKSATGAVFDTIVVDTFRSQNVVFPPVELQTEFAGMVASVFNLIKNLQKSNTILRRTRDLLLPRLVSGQVDMSELEIGLGAIE